MVEEAVNAGKRESSALDSGLKKAAVSLHCECPISPYRTTERDRVSNV
jgi:hypothetical protein